MRISRFEDIQAWQMARELCKIVYMLSSDDKFSRDFGLRDQTRRAAVSIMANIAEGFDTHSNAEFIQFLCYALRSASELQSHLYIAQDQGYLKEGQFADLYDKASMVKRLVFSFIEYLREHKKSTNSQNLEPQTSNLELS